MNPSTARLPIAIFVLTVIGVALLYWHNRSALQARSRQLAAVQELQAKQAELARKVVQLRQEQPAARIDFKEIPLSTPRLGSTNLSAPTKGVVMPRTVIVPTIPANNTAAAREVDAAGSELHASQEAVVTATAAVPAGDEIFGVNRNVVTLVFSVIILGACLYVILSKKYPEGTEKWAYASVGTVLGHWFGQ